MNKINLQLDQHFGRLFTIDFQHDYYVNNRSRTLTFEPTEDTKLRIKQLGLQFRSLTGECFLGYQDAQNLSLLIEKAKEPLKFSFIVKTQSPYFGNYTDLPFRKEWTVFHFTNALQSTSENNLLTRKDSVGEADLIEVFPPRFNYELQEAHEEIEIAVKDETENCVFKEIQKLRGCNKLSLDLQSQSSGRYQLLGNGKLLTEFYLAKSKLKFPLAIVDIHLQPSYAPRSIVNQGVFLNPKYKISFKARATRWKYLLLSEQANGKYTDFEVEDEQNQVKFRPIEEVQLRNGKSVQAICTENLLPFSEKPQGPLLLKFRKKLGKPIQLEKVIPNPSYERILPEAGDSPTYYSEIFIHI